MTLIIHAAYNPGHYRWRPQVDQFSRARNILHAWFYFHTKQSVITMNSFLFIKCVPKYTLLLACSISLTNGISIADSAGEQLPELAVTASRLPESGSFPSSRISKTEIDALGPRSTVDLLRWLPGVHIEQSGGSGGIPFLSIRGGETNFTLVLVDGVPVNDPTNSRGGGFDFNQIDVNAIEQIEVYRGGISAVYGGDAISGVIHIRTLNPTNKTDIRLRGGLDVEGNSQAGATINFGNNEMSGLFNVSARDFESPDSANDLRRYQFLAKAQYKILGTRWQSSLLSADTDTKSFPEDSGGDELAVLRDLQDRDSSQLLFATQGRAQLSNSTNANMRFAWSKHRETDDNPGIAPGLLMGIPENFTRSKYRRFDVDSSISQEIGNSDLIAGVSYWRATGRADGFIDFGVLIPTEFDITQEMTSAYGEYQMQLVDNWQLSFGVRYDRPRDFDSETSIRFSSNFFLLDFIELFFTSSEGYKLPSLFALANPIVGNPNLDPERSNNNEIGFAIHDWANTDIRITGFHNRFKDLVDFDAATFSSVNRGEVVAKGVELEFDWQLFKKWQLKLNSIYTDTDVRSEDVELRRRPDWQHALNLHYQPSDTTSILIGARYIGDYFDSSIPTDLVEIGDYTVASINIRQKLAKNIFLNVQAENLLNKRYQESVGFDSPGTLINFNISYQH